MKLGISTWEVVNRYGYEEAFRLIKASGFDAVDIELECYGRKNDNEDIYRGSEDQFISYFENIKKLAQNYELEISQTHGRCTTYTEDEQQCAYARWVSEKDICATAVLGAPACVIHQIASGSFPDKYQNAEFMHKKNKEFFDSLIPVAESCKTAFALETFGRATVRGERTVDFWADANVLKRQYDMLDTKYKTICVDTGHTNEALPFGVPNVAEAIRILGKEVTLLHLHDNNGTFDQHLPPLMGRPGTVDWPSVFDALDEIGYSGVYNFELVLPYGNVLPDAIQFMGKFLRHFLDKRGKF